MKIGIFDSGLGGLIVTKAIEKAMPQYEYVYLGDTKRVPYGNRTQKEVYAFTKQCTDYLFEEEDCALVIVACNTASARALRKIQKTEKRKIIGVLIPAAEEAAQFGRVGVLATVGTVASKTFPREIKKLNAKALVFQNPAPLLVPLIEKGEERKAQPLLVQYLKPLLDKKIEALILGCTHYPIFKNGIKKLLPKNVKIISQDEIVPKKLKEYLVRHPEVAKKLSRNHAMKILVTKKTKTVDALAKKWFGKVKPKLIHI